MHWPKCANNFYDYDCDYHAAAPIPSYSPFVFEFAFACIFIMALAGKMHVPGTCTSTSSRYEDISMATTSMIGCPPVI